MLFGDGHGLKLEKKKILYKILEIKLSIDLHSNKNLILFKARIPPSLGGG